MTIKELVANFGEEMGVWDADYSEQHLNFARKVIKIQDLI